MDLLDNPFFVLSATPRDDRRRIVALAEEKSLLSDEDAATEARAALTTPRKRLTAELAWLPGVGPKRASEVLALIERSPGAVRRLDQLPALAKANAIATALPRAVTTIGVDEVSEWIGELASLHEQVTADGTLSLVNEERQVAGFPAVTDLQALEAELSGRRQHYRSAIKKALDQLATSALIVVITRAVETTTKGGARHAPALIEDLVDSFEVEAQGFLDAEADNIRALIDQILVAASNDQPASLAQLVAKLERVVRNWDLVAQPIQVCARSRGLEHARSHEVAGSLRRLALELFNSHDHLELSQRLTILMQEVFAEVDEVLERAEEDVATLDDIAQQRAQHEIQAKEQVEQWRDEITYQVEMGLVFKDRLAISPQGVVWKGKRLELEEIARIRWGGTRNFVNGVPTGSTFNIVIATDRDVLSIELKSETIYQEFTTRLWKGVGARLLVEMVRDLKSGGRYRFGSAVVSDLGVELERYHLFRANERVRCRWAELVIGSADGAFTIAKQDEKAVSVALPYQDCDNVHVLEIALRTFWNRRGTRLSEILD